MIKLNFSYFYTYLIGEVRPRSNENLLFCLRLFLSPIMGWSNILPLSPLKSRKDATATDRIR